METPLSRGHDAYFVKAEILLTHNRRWELTHPSGYEAAGKSPGNRCRMR